MRSEAGISTLPLLAQGPAGRIFRDWHDVEYVEAIIVLVAAMALVRLAKLAVLRTASVLPDRFRFWILPVEPVFRLFVLVAAFLYITPLFIEPTAENLFAIGGALAVALGFAFKDYVSSLIAGVVAVFERPYRAGDWVSIDGTYGEVQKLGLRTVAVLTPDDTLVQIPHLKMWTSAIHNANSGGRHLMCVADLYVDPDHDGELVRELLEDVALTSPFVDLDRAVHVIALEEPWGTHYRLKAYPIDPRLQFQFRTDMTIRGRALLRRHGIRPATPPAIRHAPPA